MEERGSNGEDGSAEGEGASLDEARASAIRALELEFPGVTTADVEFDVLDAGAADEGRPARVRATVDESRWEDDEEDLPEDPAERVRSMLSRIATGFDPDAGVDVQEDDDEIRATIEGDDLGLLIGKHGVTIDALQHIAARVAFRGRADRKGVVVDAAGYRERREGALRRTADQAVEDALAYGRSVELEPMSSAERRTVHTYLRERSDIQTHSEGDEPGRRLVVTPVRST